MVRLAFTVWLICVCLASCRSISAATPPLYNAQDLISVNVKEGHFNISERNYVRIKGYLYHGPGSFVLEGSKTGFCRDQSPAIAVDFDSSEDEERAEAAMGREVILAGRLKNRAFPVGRNGPFLLGNEVLLGPLESARIEALLDGSCRLRPGETLPRFF